MSLSTFGRAAAAYADQFGFAVFPLQPREKIPLIPKREGGRGCLDATTDLDTIMRWWTASPNANVGVAMGKVSGCFALDIDPRNGGDEGLDLIVEQCGALPETVEATTGGGGRHILFRWQASLADVKWSPISPGVDVKGDGGYIVAAPSIHPSGQPYAWEASSRLGEVEMAAPPRWLLRELWRNRKARPGRGGGSTFSGAAVDFALGKLFAEHGWLGNEIRAGVWEAKCPSESLHTTGRPGFSSSTVIFAPDRPGGPGFFWCSHSHCKELYGDPMSVENALRNVAATEGL